MCFRLGRSLPELHNLGLFLFPLGLENEGFLGTLQPHHFRPIGSLTPPTFEGLNGLRQEVVKLVSERLDACKLFLRGLHRFSGLSLDLRYNLFPDALLFQHDGLEFSRQFGKLGLGIGFPPSRGRDGRNGLFLCFRFFAFIAGTVVLAVGIVGRGGVLGLWCVLGFSLGRLYLGGFDFRRWPGEIGNRLIYRQRAFRGRFTHLAPVF